MLAYSIIITETKGWIDSGIHLAALIYGFNMSFLWHVLLALKITNQIMYLELGHTLSDHLSSRCIGLVREHASELRGVKIVA
jgi:hypothetical protein